MSHPHSEIQTVKEPYRVEVDAGGCEHCQHGKQWTVVGPDDVAIGQSFEDEEIADDIAGYMNQAFQAGREGAASPAQEEKPRTQAFEELILWALGEGDEFPGLPDDWPKRKFYWRTELRRRYDAIKVGEVGDSPASALRGALPAEESDAAFNQAVAELRESVGAVPQEPK